MFCFTNFVQFSTTVVTAGRSFASISVHVMYFQLGKGWATEVNATASRLTQTVIEAGISLRKDLIMDSVGCGLSAPHAPDA